MNEVAVAWFGLLFGLSAIGGILTVVLRFLRNAGGGLR